MALLPTDYIAVNRGGTPGNASSGTYGVAPVSEVLDLANLGDAAGLDVSSDEDLSVDVSELAPRSVIEANLYRTGPAPIFSGSDLDGLISGGVYTLEGSYLNGPDGAPLNPIIGLAEVVQRALDTGPSVMQTIYTGTSEVTTNRRIGTGSPLTWSSWEQISPIDVPRKVLISEKLAQSSWTLDGSVYNLGSNPLRTIIGSNLLLPAGLWEVQTHVQSNFVGASVSSPGSTSCISRLEVFPTGSNPAVDPALTNPLFSSDVILVDVPSSQEDFNSGELAQQITLSVDSAVDVYLANYVLSGDVNDDFQITNARVKFTPFDELT